MKIGAYIFLSLMLVLMVGYCIFMSEFRKTTWGGWQPEEPEFTLSAKEIQWKKTTAEKYAVTFDHISLDRTLTEDTIIHIQVRVNDTSSLQQQPCSERIAAMDIARSYWNVIKTDRLQTWIELSFAQLLYDCDGKRSKFKQTRSYLFDGEKDTIMQASNK